MQYKTIVLELIRQHRSLHERLRQSDTLLTTLDEMALQLRSRHLELIEAFSQQTPGVDPDQFKHPAFEMALSELADSLASDSVSADSETFSLDAAMAYLRRHSPNG